MTWEQFWDEISVLQAAGWVVAAFAVLLFVVKAWPFIRNTFRILDALAQLPDFMERTDDALKATKDTLEAQTKTIDEIHHEVNYNNGSSVKDAIHRLEVQAGTKPTRAPRKPKEQ